MSAYVVSKSHIDALVTVALRGPIGGRSTWREVQVGDEWDGSADTLGAILTLQNLLSVSYRYSDPSFLDMDCDAPYLWTAHPVTLVQAIKAIHCYAYQACENPGWDTSLAKEFCDKLESALVHSLPGYDEADWEIAS